MKYSSTFLGLAAIAMHAVIACPTCPDYVPDYTTPEPPTTVQVSTYTVLCPPEKYPDYHYPHDYDHHDDHDYYDHDNHYDHDEYPATATYPAEYDYPATVAYPEHTDYPVNTYSAPSYEPEPAGKTDYTPPVSYNNAVQGSDYHADSSSNSYTSNTTAEPAQYTGAASANKIGAGLVAAAFVAVLL